MIFIGHSFSYLDPLNSFVFSLLFQCRLIVPLTFFNLLSSFLKINYTYSCYLVNLFLHLKSYCSSLLLVGAGELAREPLGLFAFFRDLIGCYPACDEGVSQNYWGLVFQKSLILSFLYMFSYLKL